MLKSLARKELRELLPFLCVAALAQWLLVSIAMSNQAPPRPDGHPGGLVGALMGPLQFFGVYSREYNPNPFFPRYDIPFVTDTPATCLFFVAGAFAAVAGIWQSWRESMGQTYLFLLHRPVSRARIFGTKLLVGLTLSQLVIGLPLVIYALWAAAPGTHPSPFRWSMTTWAWQTWLLIPLFYLAGFLSGVRPARWFGSRLFPIAATIPLSMLFLTLMVLISNPLPAALLAVLLECGFALAIFHVTRTRDFS